MKLILPDNIFSRLFANNLPEEIKGKAVYLPAPAIPSELKKDPLAAGLITPMDILNIPEVFISSKAGISFEGALSNSYIYFQPEQKDFKSLSLFGDVTSLEIILSKIFFKENYNTDIEVELLSSFTKAEGKNILVTGDLNFVSMNFNTGLSFAEEMTDLLSLPFVNFILASFSTDILEDMHSAVSGISTKIYDMIEKDYKDEHIPLEAKLFIKENAPSLIYEFEAQDIDDIHQLVRLPYFYGIVSDIIEPKFV
jgi:hypothetical protein